MSGTLQQQSYQALIQHLKKEIHDGIKRAEDAFQSQRVLTYWRMGNGIHHFLATREEPDTFHLRRVEADLDISLDVLRKMVKFYRIFPDLPVNPPLSWTQYRALLTAPEEIRGNLKARAVREGLGADRLYGFISDFRKEAKQREQGLRESEGLCLSYVRGRPFTYKTLQSKALGLKRNEIMVDGGFKIRHKVNIPPSSRITGGTLIRSVKTKNSYALKQSVQNEGELYTYVCRLRRVVDGDTLHLTVDVGFDIWLDMTARLRGIDAPEISTKGGYRTRQFVVDRLKRPETLIIKSHKSGKFGRYLTDVYYLDKKKNDPLQIAKEGIFLNQQLVDEGLARIYRD